MTAPDDLLVEVSADAAAAMFGAQAPPAPDEDFPPPPAPSQGPAAEPRQAPSPPPKAFPDGYKEPFNGLLYLGHLDEEFVIYGHTFRIVTPSQLERLQVGVLHKPYAGTLSTEIAFETVLVAAYLHSIDGQELPKPVLESVKDNGLQDRYNWVSENLKRPVISKVYERCLALEEQVDEVLDAMGKA